MKYKKVEVTRPGEVALVEDEIDINLVPEKNVLVKKHYSLISAATELACIDGTSGYFKIPGTPGYASVGEVAAKGAGVEDIEVGDIVFQYGKHSEYQNIPVNSKLFIVPKDVDEKLIPIVRMGIISFTALRVSNIELGDYVAIIGQGLVGNLAAQLAGLQGGTTIVIDPSDKRLEIAKACGADYTINPSKCNAKEKIMEITKGEGVSTLIEATGIPKVIVESMPFITSNGGGELILLGSPRGEYQYNVAEILNYCHLAKKGLITFKGAHEPVLPEEHIKYVKHSKVRNVKIILDLIQNNKLKIEPLITHIIKPEEVVDAYDGLRNKKDEYLGVLIDWR